MPNRFDRQDLEVLKAALNCIGLLRNPFCDKWFAGGIRHLIRNVDPSAFSECSEDKNHLCHTPGKYDGSIIAAILNHLPGLVIEMERLYQVEERAGKSQ